MRGGDIWMEGGKGREGKEGKGGSGLCCGEMERKRKKDVSYIT
jgi:hypothetical protein